ncbi:hypothetical protein PK98_14770 [Croceibacterium mercuriale]|uniref:Uncharacterized protein n=1 Tax=Croceibacterium mercuriale TaxID=1572751 RepID=A0A0B2BRT0_9SPHN|nr:hypothetical protein PK98_14770 [Croceibacterium mercuriale]
MMYSRCAPGARSLLRGDLGVMGEPERQLFADGARTAPEVHADIVALDDAEKASAMPLDGGELTGVISGTRPMPRAKRRVSSVT